MAFEKYSEQEQELIEANRYLKYVSAFVEEEVNKTNFEKTIDPIDGAFLDNCINSRLSYLCSIAPGLASNVPFMEVLVNEFRTTARAGYATCSANHRYALMNSDYLNLYEDNLDKKEKSSIKRILINILDSIKNKLER